MRNKSISRVADSRLNVQEVEKFKRNMFSQAMTPLTIVGGDHGKYDYYWFAGYVANEINPGRLEEAALRNWEPVKVDDMPQMALSHHSITREVKTPVSNYITRGGMILHKRLKEWGSVEEQVRKDLQRSIEKQIAFASGFVGDAKAKVFENSTSTEFLNEDDEEDKDEE